jgi:multicomponent Na+:H+ antiporter subunit E
MLPSDIRWRGVPAFLWFLLRQSAAGSVDVARRALRHPVHVTPAVFEYPVSLTRGELILASLVTLLPGTMAMQLEGGTMLVHALGSEGDARAEIHLLEERLRALILDRAVHEANHV